MKTDKIVVVNSTQGVLELTNAGRLHRLLSMNPIEIFVHNDELLGVSEDGDEPYIEFHFEVIGIKPPTIAYDSAVNINYGSRLKNLRRGDFFTLKRVGANSWSVIANA